MKLLNGDEKLTLIERFIYLWQHLIVGKNNLKKTKPTNVFFCNTATTTINTTKSPGRYYIDHFLDEQLSRVQNKHQLRILDIGCGSGYIADVLEKIGFTGQYTGIDVTRHPNFIPIHSGHLKREIIIQNIESWQTKTRFDLILSITSLEHIRHDDTVSQFTQEHLKKGGSEIHIVPGFWSLFIYLWHGYRQYTPQSLQELFKNRNSVITSLGGFGSLLTHAFWITLPTLILQLPVKIRQNRLYYLSLKAAFKIDKLLPHTPIFFGVSITHD